MPIIDAYTLIGAWPQAEVDLSVEALAAGMQARSVGHSLVTHTAAIFYNQTVGNDQCIELCSRHAPLHPVAVLNPLDYPQCLREAEKRLAQGVRAFRLCPREHGYPFSGRVGPLRELLRALEGVKVLFVDLADLPAPVLTSDIDELLPAPTVATVTAAGLGTVLHCANGTPNLWVETSRLEAGGAIEAAVEHLGAPRVVFGSGAPLRSLGSAVMSLQFAELDEATRTAIFETSLAKAMA